MSEIGPVNEVISIYFMKFHLFFSTPKGKVKTVPYFPKWFNPTCNFVSYHVRTIIFYLICINIPFSWCVLFFWVGEKHMHRYIDTDTYIHIRTHKRSARIWQRWRRMAFGGGEIIGSAVDRRDGSDHHRWWATRDPLRGQSLLTLWWCVLDMKYSFWAIRIEL